MEIKKYKVGKEKFEFVCETWETRNAWGHEVTLFRNDREVATAKVRYWNRTWEMFRYQSCMQECIRKAQENVKEEIIYEYKAKNNISRMRNSKKEELMNTNEEYQLYEKLYEQVKLGRGEVY